MRFKAYFVYLIILALLVGYYAYFEVYRKKQQELKQEESRRIFQVKADEIDQVRLIHKDGKEITVVKQGSEWSIIKPLQTQADRMEVEELLGTIAKMKYERVVAENPKDMDQFGLREPDLNIAFHTGSTWQELHFGNKNPVTQDIYAVTGNGNQVYLVTGVARTTLDKSLFTLREKSVFAIETDQVDALYVKKGRLQVSFIKDRVHEPKIWRLTGNHEFRVKKDKVEDMIRRFVWMRVKSFEQETDDDLSRYGLETPRARISLAKGETAQTLLLGANKGEKLVYAKCADRPGVVTVEIRYFKDIPDSLQAFEDRSLFSFDEDTITRMAFQLDRKEYQVEKQKDRWRFILPSELKGKKVESWIVKGILGKIKDLEYKVLFRHKNAKLKEDWWVSLYRDKDDQAASLIHVSLKGDQSKKQVVKAVVKGRTQTYEVDDQILDDLRKQLMKLEEKNS